jgi:hypothetical protein
MKDEVYEALLNGSTVDCWGSFNEAYGPPGTGMVTTSVR